MNYFILCFTHHWHFWKTAENRSGEYYQEYIDGNISYISIYIILTASNITKYKVLWLWTQYCSLEIRFFTIYTNQTRIQTLTSRTTKWSKDRFQCKSWDLFLLTVDTNQQGEAGDGGQKQVDQILLKAATSTLWTWNSSEKEHEMNCCYENVPFVGATKLFPSVYCAAVSNVTTWGQHCFSAQDHSKV